MNAEPDGPQFFTDTYWQNLMRTQKSTLLTQFVSIPYPIRDLINEIGKSVLKKSSRHSENRNLQKYWFQNRID